MANVPTDSLISYWKFDSDFNDSFGTNHLTATNSPTFATGIVGQGVDLESGSAQHLSVADNASISTGDINFSADCWVKLESKSVQMLIMGKATGATMEWILEYSQAQDRFRFYIRSGGGTFVVVDANSLGSPSTGVFYYIYVEHDATNNFVRIRVNNGTTDSTATSGTAPPDNAAPLRFGYLGTGANYLDGIIDEASFYKRVRTSQEQSDRYNGGAGNTLIVNAITITRPRSPEIIQRKNATTGDIEIIGAYTYDSTAPTAIEARVVWTNPSYTGSWEVIDSAPVSANNTGTYSGTLVDVPIGAGVGSGGVQTRFANATSVTASAINTGVGRVFATAGQSNMQGRVDTLQTFTNTPGQLCLMFRETDTSWLALTDSTNSDAVYGTPIPHVADQLLSVDPDCPLAFLTACDGGTSILISPYEWRIPDGSSYLDLLDSVTLADPPAFEGVLWLQGEAEAYFDYSTEDYYAALLTVLQALHDLPGNPYVMVGQIGMLPTSEVAGAQAIRQAQRNSWRLSYVRPGPAWHNLNLSVDQLHARTDAESLDQGTRWGLAIDGNTPPVIQSIRSTPGSGTITLVYDQSLEANATLSTAPWTVSGTVSGSFTVSAASAIGTEVSLTVSPSVAAGDFITVNHASGNTAVGVAVPTSAAGMIAAAESFTQSVSSGGVSQPSSLSPQFSPSLSPTQLPLVLMGG